MPFTGVADLTGSFWFKALFGLSALSQPWQPCFLRLWVIVLKPVPRSHRLCFPAELRYISMPRGSPHLIAPHARHARVMGRQILLVSCNRGAGNHGFANNAARSCAPSVLLSRGPSIRRKRIDTALYITYSTVPCKHTRRQEAWCGIHRINQRFRRSPGWTVTSGHDGSCSCKLRVEHIGICESDDNC